MNSLREYIEIANREKRAIPHFNVSNLETFNAIVDTVKYLRIPVIIGVSEGERNFFGSKNLVALVQNARNEMNLPIFLNADHTHDFYGVQKAIDLGFDAVVFDGAKLDFNKNITETRKSVEYAHSIREKTGKDIIVEGELGNIGAKSAVFERVPEDVDCIKTDPRDAERFVSETDIDLLAPSVGNIHGVVRSGQPDLSYDLIFVIRHTANIPLVLHGGSGIAQQDIVNAIDSGITIIHVNTEIRALFRDALERSLDSNSTITPYKIMSPVRNELVRLLLEKVELFWNKDMRVG